MTNLRVFRLTRLILAAAVSAAMTGCSGDKDSLGDLASSVQPPSNPPAIEQAQPAAEARYSYPHGSKRDPFVPLIGGARSVASQSGDGSSFTTQEGYRTSVANLLLKGILKDKKGKIALISTSDGEPYTLKSGRVYDKKNRRVAGITGVIKENSVILVTQDRAITELAVTPRADGQSAR
ncbi:MAG: hypothetical protein A2902_00365 [Elusimicrobia bacterium RIFCSPLOWO2_01_FULL_64_13]|nr:MAG: hypothetical protein A2902_00365 [Elusimicrobia bacterium RIFCSPLOWO2_01_FULL_64_13]